MATDLRMPPPAGACGAGEGPHATSGSGKGTPGGASYALEGIAMTTEMHIKARITPWDDTAFVKAFETARDEVHAAASLPDGAKAGELVQHLLREGGFPNARVEVVQNVGEKLEHVSHWLVSRDG